MLEFTKNDKLIYRRITAWKICPGSFLLTQTEPYLGTLLWNHSWQYVQIVLEVHTFPDHIPCKNVYTIISSPNSTPRWHLHTHTLFCFRYSLFPWPPDKNWCQAAKPLCDTSNYSQGRRLAQTEVSTDRPVRRLVSIVPKRNQEMLLHANFLTSSMCVHRHHSTLS